MVGVFFATWIPNVASAAGTYWIARTVGRDFAATATGRRLLPPATLAALERSYRRHHVWAIFVSRFLPGYRAVVPPFAGVAGLGPVRALAPVVVASAVWYGFLVWFAHRVGSDWTAVEAALRRVGWWLGAAALAASAVLAAALWRRHRTHEP